MRAAIMDATCFHILASTSQLLLAKNISTTFTRVKFPEIHVQISRQAHGVAIGASQRRISLSTSTANVFQGVLEMLHISPVPVLPEVIHSPVIIGRVLVANLSAVVSEHYAVPGAGPSRNQNTSFSGSALPRPSGHQSPLLLCVRVVHS